MISNETAARRSEALLRYSYGLVLILIGLDKVLGTDLIVEWIGYVGPLAQSVLPIDPATLVTVLGAAEIAVGVMFFTPLVKWAAYISIAVLAAIIVNLIDMELYDIAARDFLIALGALALTFLADARRV